MWLNHTASERFITWAQHYPVISADSFISAVKDLNIICSLQVDWCRGSGADADQQFRGRFRRVQARNAASFSFFFSLILLGNLRARLIATSGKFQVLSNLIWLWIIRKRMTEVKWECRRPTGIQERNRLERSVINMCSFKVQWQSDIGTQY